MKSNFSWTLVIAVALIAVMTFLLQARLPVADASNHGMGDGGRYQIVNADDPDVLLLDTQTGRVWYITERGEMPNGQLLLVWAMIPYTANGAAVPARQWQLNEREIQQLIGNEQ